ncbi:hypothetical protein OBBRIDRAFT_741971, partial [Obba rivulosa]
INLIVGDYLKLKGPHADVMDQALDVAKWFVHHSRALALLQQEQVSRHPDARPLTLVLPVITRWTAHYLTCTRLLELEVPMRKLVLEPMTRDAVLSCAGDKRDAKEKARVIVNLIGESSFWSQLKM